MIKHRSTLEMMVNILEHCNDGKLITHLSYRANMSHKETMKYLIIFLNSELIRKNNNRYYITEKGTQFIQKYRTLLDLIK